MREADRPIDMPQHNAPALRQKPRRKRSGMGPCLGARWLLVVRDTQMSGADRIRTAHAEAASGAVGLHVLADLHGIGPTLLREADTLERVLIEAAEKAGATVLSSGFRHFGGESGVRGVTGVVLLAESHITIHTWPEHRFAALDAFMCGRSRPRDAIEHMAAALQAERIETHSQERGALDGRFDGR